MEGHIQAYLKSEVKTLKRMIIKRDKELWLRLFLSEVDAWGKNHGMSDGISGSGDLMLPMEEKKLRTDRTPQVDTNNCLECNCWVCNEREGSFSWRGQEGVFVLQQDPGLPQRNYRESETDCHVLSHFSGVRA